MTSTGWRVGVVVPAHNESDRVGPCLASIGAALDAAPAMVSSHVVLVADACDDDTARRATQALGPRGEVLTAAFRNVGAARRRGAERLLARFDAEGLRSCWLLTTDADSRVPLDWVSTQLAWAAQGRAAVAGVVKVDDFGEHPIGTKERFRDTYELRADGTHPHVHGANLGVRADAYLAVGGWSARATAEDHCLWDRLRAAGYATQASTASYVVTSGRRLGRAPDGFAGALRDLVPGQPGDAP